MAPSSLFILTFIASFSGAQPGPCRPVCVGSSCVAVHDARVDFWTAEERCRSSAGQLMTIQSPGDELLLDKLAGHIPGEFWIGLRLPEHTCSNMSDPLRGYEWIYKERGFNPGAVTWKDRVKVCWPRCVTVSAENQFRERVCSDESDGFLCRTSHKDACKVQRVAELKVFKSKKGCSDAPCQQKCTDVSGGFTCSCEKGYAPDGKDPRRCKIFCDQEKCPLVCMGPHSCSCADGYIRSDDFCEDIDECNMNQCEQLCLNTFGGFVCSCENGYALKDSVHCVRAEEKPEVKDDSLKSSSMSATSFIWLWVLLVVVVIVVICVARYCIVRRQKQRTMNLQMPTATTVDYVAR